MTKKRKCLPIGPISMSSPGGNLRMAISESLYALRQIHLSAAYRLEEKTQSKRLHQLIKRVESEKQSRWTEADLCTANDIWLGVEDILNEHLPPFCLIDDNLVVRPDEGAIRMGKYDQDISNTRSCTWPYALEVNDHGNMTLFAKRRAGRGHRWVEVWSVV